ncbi:MAG TPA: VTT domain-containing protein [Methylomirabilota bacterium]|nr:VTT domain-containing protein [Methylomirabilota bacterium]
MLDRIAAVVLDPGISPLLVYTVVFLSCILESFFPPWPTDVIAVYAGFLAGRGAVSGPGVFLAAILGTQIGVMAVFWMSRRWGRALLAGPMGRYVPADRLTSLEIWFARYGTPAIAISRFFPGIRALVMPAAGLADFAAWKVWIFAGASVVVWNVFVVGIGLLAGTHLDWAKQVLLHYNTVALAILGIVLAGWAARYAIRRLRTRQPTASSRRPFR